MQFPVFNFKNKFAPGHQTDEKQFEWWRVVVAGLMIIVTSLLLATYIIASQLRKTQLSQDTNKTTEVSLSNGEWTSTEEKLINAKRKILPMAQIYCLMRSCIVTCSLIPAASNPGIVAGVFIDSDYKSYCPDKVLVEELIFESCKFPGNALSPGWLAAEFRIKKLSFKRCSLTTINAGAFSTVPFEMLSSLVIIDSGISVFQKSVFDSLTNLEELVIVNNVIQQAEADLLAGTAKALQIIQINNAIHNENVLINIIGRSPLPKVLLLSLIGNIVDRISPNFFKGVPNVQSVYLTNSGISLIEPDAFEPFADSIQQLFLADNKISSLPSGIFRSILKLNPNFKLTLAQNDWNCDCELQWLQNLTETNLAVIDEPRCVTPKRNTMLKFSEANFCGNETSEDTDIITSASRTTTLNTATYTTTSSSFEDNWTTINKDWITLMCIKGEETPITFRRKLMSVQDFRFRSRFPPFSAQEHENGSVYVNISSTWSTYTLVWFDNEVKESLFIHGDVGCITNVKTSVYLNHLQPEVSYTICLLDMPNDLISPFNCLSLQKKPNYDSRLWLANKDKTIIISSMIIVLIFVCVVSVIGSYYVVWRNPRLLRGSKRIIMVHHRAADAIVLPEGLQINSSKDLGTMSTAEISLSRLSSHKDYLTPVSKRRLVSRKGSVTSGSSSRSSASSYVSGITPTSMQLMSWRIGRIKDILSCNDPTKYDDVPPPLPPPRNKSIPSLSLNIDERGSSNDQNQITIYTSAAHDQLSHLNEVNDEQRL